MTVVLFPQIAAPVSTPVGSDSGVGLDIAAMARRLADSAVGSDSSNVTSGAVVSNLPQLFVQVGFDAPAGLPHAGALLAAGPTLYYRFSNTTGPVVDEMHLLDLTANGGVTRGSVSLLSGDPDLSFTFDGVDDRVEGADSGILDTDELSISAMIKPFSVTGTRTIMRRNYPSGLAGGIGTLIWAFRIVNGYLQFAMRDRNAVDLLRVYTGGLALAVNTTYHVGVIVRETQVELYLDGLLSDFFPKSWLNLKRYQYMAGDGTLSAPTPTTLVIGAGDNVAGVYSEFFAGQIDEPMIVTRALTPEDMEYFSYSRSVPLTWTWTTVSDDIPASSRTLDLAMKRGRADEFKDPETGTLVGTLRNQDRRFDPSNSGSPYAPNIHPVKPVRVIASIQVGTNVRTKTLFRGDTENWPQDWQGRVNNVPISVNDAFDTLSQVDVTVNGPVELTGARIHRILDAAHWPKDLRIVDAGLTLVQAWSGRADNAKDLLFKIVQAETGRLFVNQDGYIVFSQRNSRLLPPASDVKATFSNIPTAGEFPYVDVEAFEDKDWIKNYISVQVEDGLTYVAQDPASIKDHRKRPLELELPIIDDGYEPQAKADWLLFLYKDPVFRLAEMTIEPQMDNAMWTHILDREIGDRIRCKIFPPGGGSMIDLQAIIEYVEHKYIVGRFTTKWRFSPADMTTYWIMDSSILDTSTRAAY